MFCRKKLIAVAIGFFRFIVRLAGARFNGCEFISISFRNHFYASIGRPRKYPLHAMLWALILQRIFAIPTDSLLIVFLQYSKELKNFRKFKKVPESGINWVFSGEILGLLIAGDFTTSQGMREDFKAFCIFSIK